MIRFTKDEKAVLLFILGILVFGIVISYLNKTHQASYDIISANSTNQENKITVNINKGDKEELIRLAGIGPVLAERIISYREANGCFKTKEDVKKVKGIGDKIFGRIEDEISIR